jgi:branched-chain amino acid transport system ATP-binding protein
MGEAGTMGETILDVSDLHAFYGESHVLHGVTLSVHKGEVVTLLGRNGAGKSTTLKSIMGIVRHRRGSILLGGKETVKLKSNAIARLGIAYCPEERGIFSSLTVEENLRLPPVVASGGLSEDDLYELFPNLRERRATRQGTRLSGGEQQMLAIARILRTGARVLLLDEPTEGLAPVIVQQIGRVIKQLREQGFTILLVEQNFHFASSLADRNYVMEDGKIIESIPRDLIESKKDLLERYLAV